MSNKVTIQFPGFLTILFFIFLTLKLTGHITWSWTWVFAPIWIPIAVGLAIVGIFFLFLLTVEFFKSKF